MFGIGIAEMLLLMAIVLFGMGGMAVMFFAVWAAVRAGQSKPPSLPPASAPADAAPFITQEAYLENLESQVAMAPQTLEQLRSLGVTEQSSLALEYFFYTSVEADAAELSRRLSEMEYSADHGPAASGEPLFVVSGWTDKMLMSEPAVLNWVRNMCELGYQHRAIFDGWGTNPSQD